MLTFNWITFFVNLFAVVMCWASSVNHLIEANYPMAALMAILSLVNVLLAIQTVQRIYAIWDEE